MQPLSARPSRDASVRPFELELVRLEDVDDEGAGAFLQPEFVDRELGRHVPSLPRRGRRIEVPSRGPGRRRICAPNPQPMTRLLPFRG